MRSLETKEAQLQHLKPTRVWAKVGHPHHINIRGQFIASKENGEIFWKTVTGTPITTESIVV
jgi:hypothetical protein